MATAWRLAVRVICRSRLRLPHGGGVAIEDAYTGLWEQLVDEGLRLADVLPAEHRVPIEGLRRLIGAPDNVAFHLPGPLGRRTELGQRPAMTQLSLDTATARV